MLSRATRFRSARAELGVFETFILAAPCSEIVETEASDVIADNDAACSSHLGPAIRIFEQCGWRDTHSGKVCVAGKNALTVTKKNPGQSTLPGLLQVVASACRLFLIRAAGYRGMGCRPGRPINSNFSRATSPHIAGLALGGFHPEPLMPCRSGDRAFRQPCALYPGQPLPAPEYRKGRYSQHWGFKYPSASKASPSAPWGSEAKDPTV